MWGYFGKKMLLSTVLLLTISGYLYSQPSYKILKLDEVTARPEILQKGVFRYLDGKLYYLNKISREIKVFDYESGETIQSIPLYLEGPDAVGPEPYSFQFITQDSILVFSNFFKKGLTLINRKGKVLKRYNTAFNDEDGNYQMGKTLSRGPSSIAVIGDDLFLSMVTFNRSLLSKHSPILKLNLDSEDLVWLNQPLLYNENTLSKMRMIVQILEADLAVNNNDDLVVSFPLDHNIWVLSNGLRDVRKFMVRSQAFDDFKLFSQSYEYMTPDQIRREGSRMIRVSGQYLEFLYDPYRSVYYRVTRLPYTEKEYDDYITSNVRLPPVLHSVMVVGEDFQVIAEESFIASDYNFRDGMFVGPEGLWVLKPEGENEDEMVFEFVDLKQKE